MGFYHNRPQVQKLLQLARAEGIKQYQKRKKNHQENQKNTNYKRVKVLNNGQGHIVSYIPFNKL
jgi:hypothetical protein